VFLNLSWFVFPFQKESTPWPPASPIKTYIKKRVRNMIGGPLLAPKKAWAPVDAQELYNVI